MSIKDQVACRAKDPSTCRFHGTADVYTIQDLEDQAQKAARAGDNSKYYALRDDIRARQIEESEIRRAAWTTADKAEAAETFFAALSQADYTAKEVEPDSYEIDYTDNIQDLSDKLEDKGIEVEIDRTVSGYDIIRELHIPILNISITNSAEKEELREHVPASAMPEDYWYDG